MWAKEGGISEFAEAIEKREKSSDGQTGTDMMKECRLQFSHWMLQEGASPLHFGMS